MMNPEKEFVPNPKPKLYFCPNCHVRVVPPAFLSGGNVKMNGGNIKINCGNCNKNGKNPKGVVKIKN